MKRLTSISLIFALLLSTYSSIGLYLSYQVNLDYISEVLCVNKDRPELQCNGQCHLKKTMKNDDEQKQEQNRTQHEAQQVTLWGGEEALDMEPAVSDVLANPVIYLLKDHDPFCGSFFQPPRLTA